ncbi:hypothetical protein I79_011127 [Cricetulus griseus]|uniref:Uncharacterized protein n=1 Tax=Cricetulus griseus TaxID=10029 RepID=G3HKA8_CRIGR|nr:hypothetical protein I79_011127 [Cricetulus griseus]
MELDKDVRQCAGKVSLRTEAGKIVYELIFLRNIKLCSPQQDKILFGNQPKSSRKQTYKENKNQ